MQVGVNFFHGGSSVLGDAIGMAVFARLRTLQINQKTSKRCMHSANNAINSIPFSKVKKCAGKSMGRKPIASFKSSQSERAGRITPSTEVPFFLRRKYLLMSFFQGFCFVNFPNECRGFFIFQHNLPLFRWKLDFSCEPTYFFTGLHTILEEKRLPKCVCTPYARHDQNLHFFS
jgi:hypothetical protein